MSSTYERVDADTDEWWRFKRASLILEYKDDREWAPPPFNALYHLYYLLRGLICCFSQKKQPREENSDTTQTIGIRWVARPMDAHRAFAISKLARKELQNDRTKADRQQSTHRLDVIENKMRSLDAEMQSQSELLTGIIEKKFEQLTALLTRLAKSDRKPVSGESTAERAPARSPTPPQRSGLAVPPETAIAQTGVNYTAVHGDASSPPALLRTAQAALSSLPPLPGLPPLDPSLRPLSAPSASLGIMPQAALPPVVYPHAAQSRTQEASFDRLTV